MAQDIVITTLRIIVAIFIFTLYATFSGFLVVSAVQLRSSYTSCYFLAVFLPAQPQHEILNKISNKGEMSFTQKQNGLIKNLRLCFSILGNSSLFLCIMEKALNQMPIKLWKRSVTDFSIVRCCHVECVVQIRTLLQKSRNSHSPIIQYVGTINNAIDKINQIIIIMIILLIIQLIIILILL